MMITLLLALSTSVALEVPDTTLRISRGTTVEVTSMTRPIVIRTGAGDQVRVVGANADLSGSTLEVDAASPFGRGTGPITVTVPAWATVEVNAMNASITIEDAPERLTAETLNGRIESRGGRGTLMLSTMAGAIRVRDFEGTRLGVEAVSGEIVVDGATGTLTLESVSQGITLRNIRSSTVTAETTNGRVQWEGALDPRGRYTFATHNGEILLLLPEGTSARVRGSMFNGTFESDLPATTQGLEPSRRDREVSLGKEFTATLGKGEANVHVETFNGSIRIKRLGST
jgi:DUF4097 and DUF4098 domain-containing protein YvlB